MTAFIFTVLALYVLALTRLTKLVNDDVITDPFRSRLARRFNSTHPTLVYFVECPWCVSVWLGAATAPLVTEVLGLPWYFMVLLTLAGSEITGLISLLYPDDTE